MPDLLFLRCLMPTAGKGLLSLLREELAPVVKRTVGDPQIAGNLGQRLAAGFHQLNRFQFELFRKRALRLLHRLVPLWRTSTSSSLHSPLSRVKTKAFDGNLCGEGAGIGERSRYASIYRN